MLAHVRDDRVRGARRDPRRGHVEVEQRVDDGRLPGRVVNDVRKRAGVSVVERLDDRLVHGAPLRWFIG